MATPLEDLELPKSVVLRIAKSKLPESTQFSKEARTVLSQAATIFVNYLAATTSDIAKSKRQKSITVPNVLQALEEMDFAGFVEPVREHGQATSQRRNKLAAARRKSKSLADKEAKQAADAEAVEEGEDEGHEVAEDGEEEDENEREAEQEEREGGEESEGNTEDDLPTSPSKRPRSD